MKEGYLVDGKYRILGLAGKGGVACVYKAEHIYLGRHVAIKILKPQIAKLYPKLKEKFLEEPRRTPDDPGVVKIFDAGIDSQTGVPYLVMEFYPKSLRDLMEEGAAKEAQLKILLGAAETLVRLHSMGLVHLDVKPENIMIDRAGKPRLGDFGFAKLKAETLSKSNIWGTPIYTAPEVWYGEYSEKSDVYSLGVILAEILTDKPYSRNIEDKKLRELVEKAISHDPGARPTAAQFAQTLRKKLHPPKPSKSATLIVEASQQVTVYVDGFWIGKDTKVKTKLKPGIHTLKIDTGTQTITRTISLWPGQSLKIQVII